jgi:uncharacterized protein YfaT (DUF1175 family)
MKRLLLGAAVIAWLGASPAGALTGDGPEPGMRLDPRQSTIARAWIVRIVNEQLRRGPTPRWFHRDCAGLVRFAVAEAFRPHDATWRRASGLASGALPPELDLTRAEREWLRTWAQPDGSRSGFATAQGLVRRNSRLVSRDVNAAVAGDLLFYDQGDDQHLMVWMGRYVAYHTGTETATDSGLRAVTLEQLMRWKDTRWRPEPGNPDFVGVFRLAFLSR